MTTQDLSNIETLDKMLDKNLTENELNENIKKIKDFLLTDEYIYYKIIKHISNKINFTFSKEEVKRLVYNNQNIVFISCLIDKGIGIDFGDGKYTDNDLKAISKLGWRYYARLVPDVQELLSWAIKTSYLDKYDVQYCKQNKLNINWNKILLQIIESKRTKANFKFFKAILKSKLATQDVNLTKLAMFNYESKIVIELCKQDWVPYLTKTEMVLWLQSTKGKLTSSVQILEQIIKHHIYRHTDVINEIRNLHYIIKWLKNPLQSAIWKILKKLNITVEPDLVVYNYLKINSKPVNKSLFDYMIFTSLKIKYDWFAIFKIAGRVGNGDFMDIIAKNDHNYYESDGLQYDIPEFYAHCSSETMNKFTKYKKQIDEIRLFNQSE